MYWADELIKNLDINKKHRVDDMKTPSGHAHAGSLRAISTHGLVYEAMKKAGFNVDFTYVINDMDPMDGMPVYLDKSVYAEHMGKPLFLIPPPDGKSVNYAEQFAQEYIGAFNKLGFLPEIHRSSELYKSGKMNDLIRKCLDNVEQVRKIYKEVADQDKPEGWYPFQVICPNCGKVGSSLVTDWDGETVAYECKKDLVDWAVGCGHTGRVSPFDGSGKLMWKADWPAHWSKMEITVEGSGKDHFSDGGSHHVALRIAKEVYEIEPPYAFLHEFLLVGGKKMSSSKGNATSSADFVKILPPLLGRFLFVRNHYQKQANFDPSVSRTIPDLYDEYDRCAKAWFESSEDGDYARFYEAAQLEEPTRDVIFLPRFRTVANVIQLKSVEPAKFFAEEKGSDLNEKELEILNERIKYAGEWLEKYADEADRFTIAKQLPDSAKSLTNEQKEFLQELINLIKEGKYSEGGKLQFDIFELTKKLKLQPKDGFQAIYRSLIGKDSGPKAGWLILSEDLDFITQRFEEAIKAKAIEIPIEEVKEVKFVVGKISTIEKHENADRLQVCKVNIGTENELQIVTGATNIKVGDLVPVALPGAKIPFSTHEGKENGYILKPGNLRGVKSEAMMCSKAELLGPDQESDGIWILEKEEFGEKVGKEFVLNNA